MAIENLAVFARHSDMGFNEPSTSLNLDIYLKPIGKFGCMTLSSIR